MTKKRRLQIYLEEHRYRQLSDASSKFGVSKTKIIAQALDKWFCGQGANRSRLITRANGSDSKET